MHTVQGTWSTSGNKANKSAALREVVSPQKEVNSQAKENSIFKLYRMLEGSECCA
jgi:hypothetical protein